MTFEQWMGKVEELCQQRFECSYRDLPDICFRDLFDSGCPPSEAITELAEAADFPGGYAL